MAKSNVVYSIAVGSDEVLVEAANRAQAIRAATKPLVGAVKVLTAMELLAKTRGGAVVLDAATILKGNPADQQQGTGESPDNLAIAV